MKNKLRSDIRAFIFILLCVSLILFYNINTQAADVSTSIFVTPAETTALQTIDLTVLVQGIGGVIQGATVNISATAGSFVLTSLTWAEDSSGSDGRVTFTWDAPDTPTEIDPLNVTLTANITSAPDNIVITDHNVTVIPIDFDSSSIAVNPDTVYELHNSTISVVANSSLFQTIGGATVNYFCDEGQFFDTGTATTTALTDAVGFASVIWTADLSIVISAPIVVNITANITYSGKIVNTSIADSIDVNPMDFNSSTLDLSDATTGGGYPVTVTVTAIGDYGTVSNAEVYLDALDGTFSNGKANISGYTDNSGVFQQVWIAPEVDADVNITFTATLTYPTTILNYELSKNVTVIEFPHNFTTIDISANSTDVIIGEFVEITLTTLNEIAQPIPDANVTFTAPEGEFIGSGSDNIIVITSTLGEVTVLWDTSDVNAPFGGFDYLIEVTLIKEGYDTNTSDITIHVAPEVFKLETSSVADPTTITKGANVTFTVHVTANGVDINDSTVRIVAQSGVFASSGSEIAVLSTNVDGEVEFTWITANMALTTARDFNFTITADSIHYEISDPEFVIVHVDPDTSTPPPPDDPGLTTFEMLGILIGAVAGVLIIGVIGYQFVKRKSIS